MSFELPQFGKKKKTATSVIPGDIPQTPKEDIEVLKVIGHGAFGIVSLCKRRGAFLALKERMLNDNSSFQLFLKEVKLLHQARHDNIVKFDSVVRVEDSGKKLGMLLEYVAFDFTPFGEDCQLSSLKDFMNKVDTEANYEGFEHLHDIIALDVCKGLSYLHSHDIVHRDLKPGNILVSNQHYASMGQSTVEEYWEKRPIIAKLTDFGESRARLIHTQSFTATKTKNAARGTEMFWAPEIFLRSRGDEFGMDELKKIDVWALAMVLFILLNPDLEHPFEIEVCKCASPFEAQDVIRDLMRQQVLPKESAKYESVRKGPWARVVQMFYYCARFASGNRPTCEDVLMKFNQLSEQAKER